MALANPALILYGFEVDADNMYIDFQNAPAGPVLTATIGVGDYTLTDFLTAVATALNLADPTNTYTATVDRSIAGGMQNRITLASSGAFFSVLFASGPHAGATPASLLGFQTLDKTGAVSYVGSVSAGTTLMSVYPGYNFISVERKQEVQGSVNISANGDKEAIVFEIQTFWSIEFKYEPIAKAESAWLDFFQWAIQQKPLEFTPDYTQFNNFYGGTLESTGAQGQGLGFEMTEMLPSFPGLCETGRLDFRQAVAASEFSS